jgi:hypothetical protein
MHKIVVIEAFLIDKYFSKNSAMKSLCAFARIMNILLARRQNVELINLLCTDLDSTPG